MKRFSVCLALGMLAAGFLPMPSTAQTILRADIPFEFWAGSHQLQAAKYEIVRNDLSPHTLYLRNTASGRIYGLVLVNRWASSPIASPKLVFRQGEHGMELARILTGREEDEVWVPRRSAKRAATEPVAGGE